MRACDGMGGDGEDGADFGVGPPLDERMCSDGVAAGNAGVVPGRLLLRRHSS